MLPLSVSAYGHSRHSNGHRNHHAHSTTRPVVPVPSVPPTVPTVPPTPSDPPHAGAGEGVEEVRYQAYTTGYAALDNTPRGSTQIDLGGHSGQAGGTGTYADPITLAVGHSIVNGVDTGDYPYGTKWYVPNLRKYFSAGDSCGDGNSPQNGPCHTGYQGNVWLDLYVGASTQNAVLSCEESITAVHLVIQNPEADYAVVPGAVFDTGCVQYGDAVMH